MPGENKKDWIESRLEYERARLEARCTVCQLVQQEAVQRGIPLEEYLTQDFMLALEVLFKNVDIKKIWGIHGFGLKKCFKLLKTQNISNVYEQ